MDLDDPLWSKGSVPDSQEYLCIHKIPRPATPLPQPNQGVPATPPPQSDQIDMPQTHELKELNITGDIPDLIDVLEEVISDFDAWGQSVLDYPW